MGSPQEVYDEPATLFVARFLGSPGMNLLPGEVRREYGFAVFRSRLDGRCRSPMLARSGPAVPGLTEGRAGLDLEGPLAGNVAIEAFHGSCRYLPRRRRLRPDRRARAGRSQGSPGDSAARVDRGESMRLFDVDTGPEAG